MSLLWGSGQDPASMMAEVGTPASQRTWLGSDSARESQWKCAGSNMAGSSYQAQPELAWLTFMGGTPCDGVWNSHADTSPVFACSFLYGQCRGVQLSIMHAGSALYGPSARWQTVPASLH